MYCPIPSKKMKEDTYCLICNNKDSFSANANGELTSIFLNYLFPPADKEEITIKLLPLFTFCNDCGEILNKLIELHKSLEFIQNEVKTTVNNIKCSILTNCSNDDNKATTDVHIQKFRKIATRDYRPVLRLRKANFIQKKCTTIKTEPGELQNDPVPTGLQNQRDDPAPTGLQNQRDDPALTGLQNQRDSIIIKPPKTEKQSSSVEILKFLNENSGSVIRRNSFETCSKSNATGFHATQTAFSTNCQADVARLNANQPNIVACRSRSFDLQPISAHNEPSEFAAEPESIRPEVIIQIDPNFNFEEEETVKFEPWDQISHETEESQIMENTQDIHSGDEYNGAQTSQQSLSVEPQRLDRYPNLRSALGFSLPSSDPEDMAVKSTLWKPPGYATNTGNYDQTLAQTQNRSNGHSILPWTPNEPSQHSCQVSTTRNTGTENLTNSTSICRSVNVWTPEGFSPVNVTMNGNHTANQNYPDYSSNAVKTRLLEQMIQRRTNEIIPSLPSNGCSPMKFERPPFTIAQLIFIAITNSANHCATSETIWSFIVDTFPFYKDHYQMGKIAYQVLTLGVAFEEATFSQTSTTSRPPPPVWFVKRLAVSDFVSQITNQIKISILYPSSYMKNPDYHLKKSLGNEHNFGPTTPPFTNINRTVTNQDGRSCSQGNFEDNDITIVEEIPGVPRNSEIPVLTTNSGSNAKKWECPPQGQSLLAAYVVASSEQTGFTCPAICELIWTNFPAYQDQKDALPKRLYNSLSTSKYFVKVFNGGWPFSIFYLNTGNESAMKDMKRQFLQFSSMSTDYLFNCMANPRDLEIMARKVLGTEYNCFMAQAAQRIDLYASQIQ